MLKRLFGKKSENIETDERFAHKKEMPDKERFQRTLELFECAISKIRRIANDEKWNEDMLCSRVQKFTDGYIEIIRKELFYDYILRHLGGEEYDKDYPYPFDINVLPPEIQKDINIKGKCIFMDIRKLDSIAKQVETIKNGGTIKGERYTFFKKLGVGFAVNGNHRVISSAMTDYDLIANDVKLLDDTVYLETYTTDGASWYKKGDPERKAVGEVSDYRIALIFRILQMQRQK